MYSILHAVNLILLIAVLILVSRKKIESGV